MTNDAVIDRSIIDDKFNNLVSRLQQEIMMKALQAGGKALQQYTQQSLISKFAKATTAKGKGKRTMVEDVHIITDKAMNEVIVSVMNYLTKWYEMGTGERYLKEDHPKDQQHHKTYKKGESRGHLTGLHYFREAREQHADDVIDVICKVVAEELKNEFDR